MDLEKQGVYKKMTNYCFLYNFNYDDELIHYYGRSFGFNLSKDMETNSFISVIDIMKKHGDFIYNCSSWNNNYDMELFYNKLIYYNYEYYNKLVNNKIRYVRFSRSILDESCLLYLNKHLIRTEIIDSDRLISCYKDCLRIREVWNRYLFGYGNMYILDINLSDDLDYNLLKLSRFIGNNIKTEKKTFEIDDRFNGLRVHLRKLLGKM